MADSKEVELRMLFCLRLEERMDGPWTCGKAAYFGLWGLVTCPLAYTGYLWTDDTALSYFTLLLLPIAFYLGNFGVLSLCYSFGFRFTHKIGWRLHDHMRRGALLCIGLVGAMYSLSVYLFIYYDCYPSAIQDTLPLDQMKLYMITCSTATVLASVIMAGFSMSTIRQ